MRHKTTKKISPERQARETARLEREIERYEDRIHILRANLRGLRTRLRYVKRGLVPVGLA